MTTDIRPGHVGISVGDLQASLACYHDMLGFELVRIVDIPAAEDAGSVALLRNGDFIVELFALPTAAPLPPERLHPAADLLTRGIERVAYAVSDIDVLMVELKPKNVDVVRDTAVHDGDCCAFVCDNSGNLVEFMERSSVGDR